MDLRDLDERYDRDVVEPVIAYVNEATGIEWLSVGVNLGRGIRYISNVKARTWAGELAGVYALLYIAEIAKARGVTGDVLRTAHRAGVELNAWMYEAGLLDIRNRVRDKADEVREYGKTEGHPVENR